MAFAGRRGMSAEGAHAGNEMPTVKTCHHECNSSKKAAGHPMAIFQRVMVLQKILSRFQTKKPKAKMPAPELKMRAMDALTDSGSCFDNFE